MPLLQNVDELIKSIHSDANSSDTLKQQAEKLSEDIAKSYAYQSDVWIYRAVVLGATVLATILGGLGLAFMGNASNYKIPAEIVALGSAAVGALAGLLAPSPREGNN